MMARIRCPRCHHWSSLHDNPFKPFCSERCKLIELGHWIEEKYRIPAETVDQHDVGLEGQTD